MVAMAHSVEPYMLYRTSPKMSCTRVDRSGLSADPAIRITFSADVSYLAITSGPSSTIRCSIVGTATNMSALCSAISFSVPSALNRRAVTTLLPSAAPTR